MGAIRILKGSLEMAREGLGALKAGLWVKEVGLELGRKHGDLDLEMTGQVMEPNHMLELQVEMHEDSSSFEIYPTRKSHRMDSKIKLNLHVRRAAGEEVVALISGIFRSRKEKEEDSQKVRFAAYQLEDDAHRWWYTQKRIFDSESVKISWKIQANDEARRKRFEGGLSGGIRLRVKTLKCSSYRQAVNMALNIEKEMEETYRAFEKRRLAEQGEGSSSKKQMNLAISRKEGVSSVVKREIWHRSVLWVLSIIIVGKLVTRREIVRIGWGFSSRGRTRLEGKLAGNL
ncbi:hypothetical protein ACLOJK_000018 [Asimina triloba]